MTSKKTVPLKVLLPALAFWIFSAATALAIEVFSTNQALRSSVKILSWMNCSKRVPIYSLTLDLVKGEKVLINGCVTVTNDTGYNVGWGVVLTVNCHVISPRLTRNVTPDMHHDSNSVMGYFEVPEDGTYEFSISVWAGSTASYGRSLKVETSNMGQLIVQITQ